ncbi:MAG TPA: hypothetical protein VHV08_09635 [Pirellulales bacterium]|jgi:hypothetical protein|nr:hypothetical protein [Pirellulales bacterium]
MSWRRLLTMAGLLAACGFVGYALGLAAPASSGAAEEHSQDAVAVRYARAQLRLAELTLQKAQASNQRVAGTLVGSLVSQLSDDVEMARVQLKNAERPEGVDYVRAAMQRAELGLRLAEGRLRRATDANQRIPGTVGTIDLERLRLGVEIAQLRMESGKAMVNATPIVKLQWQIEMLNEELASIKQRTYLLSQNRFQF